MSQKALIIEDDGELAVILREELAALGYEIEHAPDGLQGLRLALEEQYSFIVLDLNLPKLEGTEVCKQIRQKKPEQPIMILSSRSDELSKVLHLELGADDYLAKPFSLAELKARIKSVLRRSEKRSSPPGEVRASDEKFACRDFMFNLSARTVKFKGREMDLTSSEFDILALLAQHPGRVYSRDELVEALHGKVLKGYDAAITSHINRLRCKIEPDPSSPMYLQTVRGAGYRLYKPEED